jgi:hypothetical protein
VAGPAHRLQRDEALAGLTKQYFNGHGPATLQDFVWWSGLKTSEAKTGLEMVAASLRKETIRTETYWTSPEPVTPHKDFPSAFLLPGFDEYMLGYTDRSAVIDPVHAHKLIPDNNGRFLGTMVLNGRVVGTWKRALSKKAAAVTMQPFIPFRKAEKQAFVVAAERYGEFIRRPIIASS